MKNVRITIDIDEDGKVVSNVFGPSSEEVSRALGDGRWLKWLLENAEKIKSLVDFFSSFGTSR